MKSNTAKLKKVARFTEHCSHYEIPENITEALTWGGGGGEGEGARCGLLALFS